MTAYEQAHAEALKALQKYEAALYEPQVTKAKDIAGALGRSGQRIGEIIRKLTTLAKAQQ